MVAANALPVLTVQVVRHVILREFVVFVPYLQTANLTLNALALNVLIAFVLLTLPYSLIAHPPQVDTYVTKLPASAFSALLIPIVLDHQLSVQQTLACSALLMPLAVPTVTVTQSAVPQVPASTKELQQAVPLVVFATLELVFALNVLEIQQQVVITMPVAVRSAPLVVVEELESRVLEVLHTATTEYAPSVRPVLSALPPKCAPGEPVLLVPKDSVPLLHQLLRAKQLSLFPPYWLSLLHWHSCYNVQN